MTLLINFEDSDIKLFTGINNGRKYKSRCCNYSVIELVFNNQQLVTSSFFVGLLEDYYASNPYLEFSLSGGVSQTRAEFNRALRRLQGN